MTKSIAELIFLMTAFILNNSCGGGGGSISTISTTDAFDEAELDFNPQIDILWVVDPSRSMKTEIESIQNNIQEFIGEFITKGYDYQMGVITTAAWSHLAYLEDPTGLNFLDGGAGSPLFARLHRGDCTSFPPAVDQTAILSRGLDIGTFVTRFRRNFDVYGIALDTSGCGLDFFSDYEQVVGNIFDDRDYNSGVRSDLSVFVSDERPLQSVQTFLELDRTATPRFSRPDAYLAVIIISDELDGSRDSLEPSLTFAPSQPGVPVPGNHTAEQYVEYIRDVIKDGNTNKFGIFSFVNLDLDGINIAREAAGPENTFDINGDRNAYIQNLNQIRGEILTSATTYALTREPIESTITIQLIRINGTVANVPRSTGPGVPGWVYEPDNGPNGSIAFIGEDFTPGNGDGIVVDFTPRFLSSGQISAPFLRLSNTRIAENAANGTVLGSVTLANRTLLPTETAEFSLVSDPVGSFTINTLTGEVSVANSTELNTELGSSHQLAVEMTVTNADTTTTTYDRNFIVSILDVPDVTPVASDINIEVSEATADPTGLITITGNASFFVNGVDGSEIHTYARTSEPIYTPATPVGSLIFNVDGSFTYSVSRDDLGLVLGTDFELEFDYTVTGTNTVIGETEPIEGSSPEINTATVNIVIKPTNSAPRYLAVENPINEGLPVRPSSEGISFGRIPIDPLDVTFSGTPPSLQTIERLVDDGPGDANFMSEANGAGVHEVTIQFPEDKIYEVSCVRIYRDNSSLENAIYQVLTGGPNPIPITREVFPVGATGNSNRPIPANAQGACRTLSSSYFTIYTDRDYIGGSLRLIRPFGAKNRSNHTELRLDKIEVYGTEARTTNINLLDHFRDEDLLLDSNDDQINPSNGETLSFFVTDAFGEGPAPGWANVVGDELQLLPSSSVNDTLGVLARDAAGFEAFTTIQVIGSGGGSVANAPPISLLKLDDTLRGGLSMRRWGGTGTPVPAQCTGQDNRVVHIEIDNFIEKPFSEVNDFYDIQDFTANPEQEVHVGDIRGGEVEDGWCSIPVHEDNKYPTASTAFCVGTNFNTSSNIGKVVPCLNNARSYGEVYSGYFVPAITGVYKFRTRIVDNTVLLRIAPTEYAEDTQRIFLANWRDPNLEGALQSLINDPTQSLSSTAAQNSEFAGSGSGTSLTNFRAIPYDTNIFFDLNNIPSESNYNNNYTRGYMYMTQGNVYAFEMRFGEGGGAVSFDFQFDRRDLNGTTWDGWRPMDASVVVPDRGVTTAHTPFVIPIAGDDSVSLEARDLFYDAELDLLEYTARLVNADGTTFETGLINFINLNIGLLTGTLAGTLNSAFLNLPEADRPRIVFRATERNSGNFAESLPIKLQ